MAAKERSPRYPGIALEEAIRLARVLFDKNGRTAIPAEVVAKAWGYKSASGPMRSKLGALKSYGLVAGSGKVTVTPRLITLAMTSTASTEHKEALFDAATSPPIFGELIETHREADQDAIRYYLVSERQFTNDGAKKLAETFTETMSFAGLAERSYPVNQTIKLEPIALDATAPAATARATAGAPAASLSGTSVYRWPLGRDMSAEVVLKSSRGGVTPEHLRRLRQYLELAEAALKEDSEEDPE